MRRNTFGEPQPSSLAEIIQAMDEKDLMPADAAAQVFAPDGRDEPPFDGWCAEIADCETGEKRIATTAFSTEEVLRSALIEAGIVLIEDGWS